MKQVWKCDHCSQTSTEIEEIKRHEKDCCFNPVFKKCWSCDRYEDYYGSPYCTVEPGRNVWKFELDGNCPTWYNENWLKINRDNKIDQILP